MKNLINLFLLVCLMVYVLPSVDNSLSVVSVEGDVVTGNTLPRWGVLCQDANVQGNPHDGFAVEYTLPKGTRVRLHEQGGDGRSWVMIEPAYWIRGETICGW